MLMMWQYKAAAAFHICSLKLCSALVHSSCFYATPPDPKEPADKTQNICKLVAAAAAAALPSTGFSQRTANAAAAD